MRLASMNGGEHEKREDLGRRPERAFDSPSNFFLQVDSLPAQSLTLRIDCFNKMSAERATVVYIIFTVHHRNADAVQNVVSVVLTVFVVHAIDAISVSCAVAGETPGQEFVPKVG